MKAVTALLIVLSAGVALAAGGGHESAHDAHHIPLDKIGWQATNLGILLLVIFFFIKNSIVEAFAGRQKDYLDKSEKTKAALKEAESALLEIKTKLSELESSEQKALEVAKKEAALLSENMIKEAELVAAKLKKEAEMTIANEVNKAKIEINSTILNNAISIATQKISTNAASAAGSQEASFVKQLEQVRA